MVAVKFSSTTHTMTEKKVEPNSKIWKYCNKTSKWIKLKFRNADNKENIEQYQSTGFHTKPRSYSDLFKALDIPKINGNNGKTYFVPIQNNNKRFDFHVPSHPPPILPI